MGSHATMDMVTALHGPEEHIQGGMQTLMVPRMN
jgi:hypothetical protein